MSLVLLTVPRGSVDLGPSVRIYPFEVSVVKNLSVSLYLVIDVYSVAAPTT